MACTPPAGSRLRLAREVRSGPSASICENDVAHSWDFMIVTFGGASYSTARGPYLAFAPPAQERPIRVKRIPETMNSLDASLVTMVGSCTIADAGPRLWRTNLRLIPRLNPPEPGERTLKERTAPRSARGVDRWLSLTRDRPSAHFRLPPRGTRKELHLPLGSPGPADGNANRTIRR